MKCNVCLKWLELGDQESRKEGKVPRSRIQDVLRDPIRDDQSISVDTLEYLLRIVWMHSKVLNQ